MVALIFRHLATLPGALEWVWDAISPAWQSGDVQESAWRIAGSARLAPMATISPAALVALGVPEGGQAQIRRVVDAYNRANPVNLMTTLCILQLGGGNPASRVAGKPPWQPPEIAGPIIAMGALDSLPRELNDLLASVAGPSTPGGERVVQSLYRHFLHHPAFLALVVTLLKQRMDDGSVDKAARWIHQSMLEAAAEIASTLSAPPAPHPGIESACRRFSDGIIPRMIVVGRLLDEALPKAP